jgi:D-alanyl-D-alanine carboxypeptidase (penicillin-binding protein 5/6)
LPVLIGLLSLLCVAAGPPGLSGTQPGSPVLYAEDIAAIEATRQPPLLSASDVLLANSDTGQILLAVNPDNPRPMASLTKLMTALLALERSRLDEQVVVSSAALVGESAMGLQAGEVVTVEDLLWGLLLNSGNDAAMALAQHVAGSVPDFVIMMNARAAELGLHSTHFTNPHGMDASDHYGSAYDLWRLAEEALTHPKIREIVATQGITRAGHPLWNRNELLATYPDADGVKTGTTDLAGQSLVASVTRDGHRVLAVILGSSDRYADARALLDFYFSLFRWNEAPQPSGPTAWIRDYEDRPLRITAPAAPDLFLPTWQWSRVRTQLVPGTPGLNPPGSSVGTVRWYLGTELLGEAPAVTSLH